VKIHQPYYIKQVNQEKDGDAQIGFPLGKYNVHLVYDPPISAIPTASQITGVLHAAGGSIVSVSAELPENAPANEYVGIVVACNGAPIINSAFCTDYTTFGIA
jgi:hypothetical protein